jgi:trehalose/maltose hydrolase-like predicted phosphorylase
MQKKHPEEWQNVCQRLQLKVDEIEKWKEVRIKMYQNWDKDKNILIQDDTFMDQPEEDLSKFKDRNMPILEIIGYERVMRIRILRQADVLLLMYLLDDRFSFEQKKAAFEFYEPITTHDSSLSFNTHCIMAAELEMKEKAFDYFFKTCRLDLDDEQDTAGSGLHGASLGGTWQAIVNGFGGMRVVNNQLSFKPILPPVWNKLSFQVHFQGRIIRVSITDKGAEFDLLSGIPLTLLLNDKPLELK